MSKAMFQSPHICTITWKIIEVATKTEVLIHVPILNAILELYGLDITLNSPVIVSAQGVFISPDFQHDIYCTFRCQILFSDYLKFISAYITVMHKFTDGCLSQYKSRKCMGDISSVAEFKLFNTK